ncbi:sugar (and other) transporter family protein [Acinetobacter sp. 1130196]|uniref:MFS transporter n=1 Tax=Acinetobacter calcoaceticus/baumannii complex TaxID=909768 RepID=UPI000445C561|nr:MULTISPECIES: aromatic acid/H+ symport family MFS transporter [Acinetobacter calcoaceticus/baumannii complex]EKU6035887.1 aromatic acid/H+ symport family MFS transporter [Acinetobacter nosocomialis]EXR09304.1 sugar (and other) transporter family protein [Acinetobacter sp. 1130196]MBP1511806.1 aromatic acid/H+ symport family MFS transporter [Acinetobacter nosocomialis]SSV26854.1 4-hydroxybenzoate transporter [Acinetobacter nosocomialis]
MSQNSIDVQSFIDEIPLSSLQKLIMWLCFLIVAIDGFDTAAVGFIAPALKAEWGLQATDLAPLFGAGLFGLMAGALIFGPLSDKLGRKPILIGSVIMFGIASVFASFSADLQTLIIWRFLTGLGLGGALPNAITLTSEYAPTSRRSNLVTMMFCGFTVGSALGGIFSAQLLPHIGWHGILLIGGVLPLATVPFLYFLLPESIRFLVLKKKSTEKIEKIIHRIAPHLNSIPTLVPTVNEVEKSRLKDLFNKGFALGTFLIWFTFFMSLLIIYMISSWMPTLLTNEGFNLSNASWLTSIFQIGGTIGAIVLGLLMDKMDATKILSTAYVFGGLFLICLGFGIEQANTALLMFAMFGVGAGISGSQVGANAFASGFYPTHCRATGVSWANAVGRSGSIVGSIMGGWLMSLNLSSFEILSILAVPAFCAAVSLLLIKRLKKNRSQLLVASN